VFGSELTKELTGRSDIRPGVEGLFNTVIREIDYEVARILGLESLVELVRAIVLEIARRLSKAGEAKREVVKGSEELLELRKSKRKRGGAGGEGGMFRRLDEFMRKSGGEGGK